MKCQTLLHRQQPSLKKKWDNQTKHKSKTDTTRQIKNNTTTPNKLCEEAEEVVVAAMAAEEAEGEACHTVSYVTKMQAMLPKNNANTIS